MFIQGPSDITTYVDLKQGASDSKVCGLWLLHAAFRVTLSEKASGLETKSALKLILCFLWLGFKRRMSAELRWSPFAYLGSRPLWKSVWEGSSMLRAGPWVTTVILIHCHPFRISLAKRGGERESPAHSICLEDVSWLCWNSQLKKT